MDTISLVKDAAAGVLAAAERDAVPAGGSTQPAPGRLWDNARPASRPVCYYVAGLGQAEAVNDHLLAKTWLAKSWEVRWS